MIYIFDLDNTLCDTKKKSDGNWNYIESLPFIDRIKIVNNLYENGHKIIIDSARGCVSGKNWHPETLKQLESFGLKFHQLRTGIKLNGDFFIDDKSINSNDFFNHGINN